LQKHCETVIQPIVDEDNINLICDIALYHECSILGPHCTSFLLSHLEDISVTPSFGYLNDKGILFGFINIFLITKKTKNKNKNLSAG